MAYKMTEEIERETEEAFNGRETKTEGFRVQEIFTLMNGKQKKRLHVRGQTQVEGSGPRDYMT